MNVWRKLHKLVPLSKRSQSVGQPVPMRQSQPIEVDGIILGTAIEHELGVRFVALDVRIMEMDQSIWPSIDYTYKSARQLLKSGRAVTPF